MRIAVLNITGGGMSGGYRKYLQNVIPRMAKHPDVEAILCTFPKLLNGQDWFDTLTNVEFAHCSKFQLLHQGVGYNLKRVLEKFCPDVLFIPTGCYLQFKNIPVVNMVRNMEPFVYSGRKNPFSEKLRNFVRRKIASNAVRRSHRVIVLSHYVKQFLVDNLNIPENNISVILHGIRHDKHFKEVRPSVVPESWKGDFLFTAGSIRPARGLEDIIYALKHLDAEKFDINLLIAGAAHPNMLPYLKSVKGKVAELGLLRKIIWTDSLNNEEMNWCYKNCRLFVMTSREEALAMTALEAMSRDCICITANISCLPEVFGNAAVYYPPNNSKFLAEKIQTALAWSDRQRSEMHKLTRKRIAEFPSWDETVEMTVNELKLAVESHNHKETGADDGLSRQ
jgi:glycosyltransferase involved in cell wall biosynthesis